MQLIIILSSVVKYILNRKLDLISASQNCTGESHSLTNTTNSEQEQRLANMFHLVTSILFSYVGKYRVMFLNLNLSLVKAWADCASFCNAPFCHKYYNLLHRLYFQT